jgi:hypothetical protein
VTAAGVPVPVDVVELVVRLLRRVFAEQAGVRRRRARADRTLDRPGVRRPCLARRSADRRPRRRQADHRLRVEQQPVRGQPVGLQLLRGPPIQGPHPGDRHDFRRASPTRLRRHLPPGGLDRGRSPLRPRPIRLGKPRARRAQRPRRTRLRRLLTPTEENNSLVRH